MRDGLITAFSSEVSRAKGEFFPGSRIWLDDAVEQFLADESRRHLVLLGEPGVGKTTYLAHLADKYQCPRFFHRVGQELEGGVAGGDPAAFLVSIGQQLGQKYGASVFGEALVIMGEVAVDRGREHAEAVGVEVEEAYLSPFRRLMVEGLVHAGEIAGGARLAGVRIRRIYDSVLLLPLPTLVHEALLAPLTRIAELYPDETVLLLVDGVDVSLQQSGTRLVDVIPTADNLRVVMTSRRGQHLARFRASDTVDLSEIADADGADNTRSYAARNRKDARDYITHVIHHEDEIAQVIHGRDSLEHFIDTVTERCDGNFLYLHYFFQALLEDARAGVPDLLSPLRVPRGLNDFYRVILVERLRSGISEERWEDIYLPVFGVLSVAQDSLGALRLAEIAGVEPTKVASVLARAGQFLDEVQHDGDIRYRFYHSSFGEYLVDARLNRDYPIDGPAYHYRIAAYYRAGNDRWSAVEWKMVEDDYPFRYLAKHLKVADKREELNELVDRTWMAAHFEREHSHRGFFADVELALEAAVAEKPPNLVQIFRGCLIQATLASSAAAVPEEALAALARLGRVANALGYADLMQDPETRCSAYLAIAGALLERGGNEAAKDTLRQALVIVPEVGNESGRIEALENVTHLLEKARDGEGLRQALLVADTIGDHAARASLLGRLAGALTEARESAAAETAATSLALAGSIQGEVAAVKALGEVGRTLAEQHLLEQASHAVKEARARAEALEDDVDKARALNHVASGLAGIRDAVSLCEIAREIVATLERFAGVGRTGNATDRLLRAMNVRGSAAESLEALVLVSRVAVLIDAIEERHADAEVEASAQTVARLIILAEQSWAATALARLVVALTQADCEEVAVEIGGQVLAAVSEIEDAATQGAILEILAAALRKKKGSRFAADLADRLIEMISELDDKHSKGNALRTLILILLDTGDEVRLGRALASATALAESAPDLRVEIVQILAKAGDTEGARRIAARIGDEKEKADALSRLAAAMGRAGQYDLARGVAADITMPADKAYAWAVLADSLAKAGQEESAFLAVDRALISANASREVWTIFGPKSGMYISETLGREEAKSDALVSVAEALARTRSVDGALKVVDAVEKVGYASGRATALAEVAKALIETGETGSGSGLAIQALALAEALETSEAPSDEVQSSISQTKGPNRQNPASLSGILAAELADPEARALMRGWIAQVVASADSRDNAIATIDKAICSVEFLEEGHRSRALLGVLPALEKVGYEAGIARAEFLAQASGDEETIRHVEYIRQGAAGAIPEDPSRYFTVLGAVHQKATALSRVAEILAKACLMEKAEDAAMHALTTAKIDEMEEVAGDVVTRVAQVFGKVRSVPGLEEASKVARGMRGITVKAGALIGVGRGFAALGDQVRAEAHGDLALSVVETEGDKAAQAIEMSWIALVLAEAGRMDRARIVADRALAIAGAIGDDSEKSRALVEVIADMGEMEYETGHSRALAVAEVLGTETTNSVALPRISEALAQAGRKERARRIADRALASIKMMDQPMEQAVAFSGLSNAFLKVDAKGRAIEVATMAFMTARRTNRKTVFHVLESSAAVIAAIDEGETLRRVFEALQEVEAWWS
jgi:tetratricopeptide (TPR) repeat protein